ncbi:hypothetical protein [Rhizobium sp. PP-CC-3G-465]|uniref:hypothetical protein n=1 Tax=Rhizobium sp. PP-CC-3G-465 TaxID=2135648 RepID=UPI00104A9348|nr:hypothetical protein C8J33_1344 [Rhizobium sp. PP-CC-3G-465]
MRLLTAVAMAAALAVPAQAWTTTGSISCGGAGGLPCTDFLNAMSTARQQGMETARGITTVNLFAQYAFGFVTAYNLSVPGMRDIIAGIRASGATDTAMLITLERWCEDNITEDFDNALFNSVNTFSPTALRGPTE